MEAQQELVAYLNAEEVSGQNRRQLVVPEQHWAVVQDRHGVRVLSPGTHNLLSAWDTFLGRFAPPVWLMPQGALTMQPVVANLLSYDNQMIEADMLIQARIFDPVRLWQELVTGQVSLERQQVERELSRRLQPVLSKHVRQFTPEAVQHQAQPVDEIQRAVMPSLRAILEGWGLELLSVTHLGVRPALEVVEIQRQRQAIEQKLADLRLQGHIDELENAQILQQAKDDMDLGLTGADQVHIQMLSKERNALEALIQVLQERLERLEGTVRERLDYLAGDPSAQPPSPSGPTAQALNHTADWLEKWGSILRLFSTALALLAAVMILFFPQISTDRFGLNLAIAGLGFLAALFAYLAPSIAHRQSQRYRERAEVKIIEDQQASARQARIAQEQGIRRYLEQRLRQVSSNCQQTWQRVYERDLELATGMRKHCANAYSVLADNVMAADNSTSAYLSRVRVPLDDLAQMLLLSQGVLDDAQAMVTLSQDLYQAAVAGDLETVRRGATRLDEGRLAIENRFAERQRFLLAQ